ncbi:ribonuclease R family protein [Cylindrospermopsis curvispora]|uniref:VacB/RNase II family 3'-5' exoribonuclease n=1 Tax=Cylindrospermopsis curvispora GIHE-G1 TaxID=2666332 RepID=A0A7H0EZU7_9CYAN|nr:ribonuclease R family protein [Cylindrospermopsis curvispora]QNP29313.1 VacB/RNase II family 3'-5' exoribonuclease [Cylindrospermopsis curvispora GIHE-G1]
MEFSIATLLANFTDDKLVARKVLEKKLGCEDEDSLEKLHIALEVLEKVGLLVKDRGKYRRVSEEGLIEAKLRCSSKGFCFAIQDPEGAEDIYIRESHLSHAWNGDRVLVRILKEGSRRRSPEGEVKLILERSNHTLLARIKQVEGGFRAVPLDDRLLFELKLVSNGINLQDAIDHLAHVEVIRYPLAQYPPLGRVVQILGTDAEAAADIDLVTCKHDLSRNFAENVLDAAARLPKNLLKANLRERLDLRSVFTLAIEGVDGDGVVENAFSLEKHSVTTWQLMVHITDLSVYIHPDEILDREALKRGKTIHLGNLILPMLPHTVAECCSLLPGSDRLALSFIINIDIEKGQITEWEIQPSVVNVDTSITHEQAQSFLAGESSELTRVIEMLNDLTSLAQIIKKDRLSRGCLELNLPLGYNPYHDEGSMGAIIPDDSPLGSVLRELILMVNQLMAQHLSALDVPALWRVQGSPDSQDVQEMLKLAVNLGVELIIDPELEIQSVDYQHLTGVFAESPSEQVLTYLLQDTLKPAVYSTVKAPHFGLALPAYIHFSSPLRRYPDLVMQRVYHAVLEYGRDRRNSRVKERVNLRHSSSHQEINWNVLPPEVQQELQTDLNRILVQINEREKQVYDAETDLAGLQKAQVMKQQINQIFPGVITGVQSYGFFVEIEVPPTEEVGSHLATPLRVEGLVHVSSLKDDWYEYRARQQALFGRKNRASYRLGDQVFVQVKSVDYYRQQIDLVTTGADGKINGSETTMTNDDRSNIYSSGQNPSFDMD